MIGIILTHPGNIAQGKKSGIVKYIYIVDIKELLDSQCHSFLR